MEYSFSKILLIWTIIYFCSLPIWLVFQFWLLFALVILVEVAVLTHVFGVVHFRRMWTCCCQRISAVQVVTMITHTLGVVSERCMHASGNGLNLSPALFDNSLRVELLFLYGLDLFRWARIRLFLILLVRNVLLQLRNIVAQLQALIILFWLSFGWFQAKWLCLPRKSLTVVVNLDSVIKRIESSIFLRILFA